MAEVSEPDALAVSGDVAKKKRARRKRAEPEELASGSVRIRVRGTRPDGRPFTRSETFSQGTQAERWAAARNAQAALWRWAEEVEAGVIVEEESLTLATAAERLRKEGVRFRASDRSAMKRLRSLQGVDLRELTDAKMSIWAAAQARTEASASYVRYCYALARRIVSECVARKWIREVPWSDTSKWLPPESKTRTRRAPTDAEMAAVLAAAREIDAQSPPWCALYLRIVLGHHIAARPLEIARLGPVDLVQKGQGSALRFQAVKNGAIRVVSIPEELADMLREQWAALPSSAQRLGLFFPIPAPSTGKWKSRIRGRGSPRRGAGYETGEILTKAEVARVRELSGFKDFVAYHLRHGGITSLAKVAGMGLAQLQEFTKHKSQRMLTRYASPQTDERTETALRGMRIGTPTPTPSVVVFGGNGGSTDGAKSHAEQGGARVHAVKLSSDGGSTVGGSRPNRAVGAERLEGWRKAIGVIRERAEDAGSVAAWVEMLDGVDAEAIADDLATAIGTGRLSASEAAFATAVLSECRSRVERLAPTPQVLTPLLGLKKSRIDSENKGLRLVGGYSFTLTNPRSSDEE